MCNTPQDNPLNLCQVPTGASVWVVALEGGHTSRRRLNHLGIHAGDIITVRRNTVFGGPLLISVHHTTVAIGKGLAAKIKVKFVANGLQSQP